MSQLPEISIVVPTFNSADHIGDCISSIRRTVPEAEVIVVDNDSTDGTRGLVSSSFPGVMLLAGHGNIGFGRACNLGSDRASGELVLFLNPDTELAAVDRVQLVGMARAKPVGLVGGMIIDGTRAPQPTLRRRYRHWLAEFFAYQLLANLTRHLKRTRYVAEAGGRGRYAVSGALLLVAKDEFRSIGGFDERFFMYYEDDDLSRRYRGRGHRLRSTRALLAGHVGSTSASTPLLLALSFLGWLEYVNKWDGEKAAMRAATVARSAYSVVLVALRSLASLTGSERVAAKANQFAAMLSHLAAGASVGASEATDRRYPAATPIARRSVRSDNPRRELLPREPLASTPVRER